MARQIKAGLDYFSHDVDIMQDKKMRMIKATHGIIGYAIYLRLLEELYRDNGYYLQIDDDFNILFSDDNNILIDVYINVLNDCINKKLFNETMYKKYSILTSERIQKNYISGTERRKEVVFIKDYLLIKPIELYSDKVNVVINDLNVDINSLNADIGTQRKVKYIKEEEIIKVYKSYPEAGNKKDCIVLIKNHLKTYEVDELVRATERYQKETIEKRKGFPELKYQNPKTFFNKTILNYVDEFYEENVNTIKDESKNNKWQQEANFEL